MATKQTTTRKLRKLSPSKLTMMIEQATVDAYGASEQATGWLAMFENYLELPFVTDVLGVPVTVETLELRADNRIVAVCQRGKSKLAVDVMDLPLPSKRPVGAEWIDAYCRWLRGNW
jgi:hypothetical protein